MKWSCVIAPFFLLTTALAKTKTKTTTTTTTTYSGKTYTWTSQSTISGCPTPQSTKGLTAVPVTTTSSAAPLFSALVKGNGAVANHFLANNTKSQRIHFNAINSSRIEFFLPSRQRAFVDNRGAHVFAPDCSVGFVLPAPNLLNDLRKYGSPQKRRRSQVLLPRDENVNVNVYYRDQCGNPITGHDASGACTITYPAVTDGYSPALSHTQDIAFQDNGVEYIGSCNAPNVTAETAACKQSVKNFIDWPTQGWVGQLTNFGSAIGFLQGFIRAGVVRSSLAGAAALLELPEVVLALGALATYEIAVQAGADSLIANSICLPISIVHLEVDAALDTEPSPTSIAFQGNYPFTAVTATRTVSLATVTCSSSTSSSVSASASASPGANLILNPSFEDDSAWELSRTLAAYGSGNAYDGDRYLYFTKESNLYPYVQQDLPAGTFYADKTYHMSFAYFVLKYAPNCGMALFCESSGSQGIDQIAITVFPNKTMNDGKWHVVSGRQYADGSGTGDSYCAVDPAGLYGRNNACSLAVDAVEVYEI